MRLSSYSRKKAVLLDTNLLVLQLVGLCDPNFVEQCRRTKAYSTDDFLLLNECLTGFEQLVVTPHILTETSNLLEKEVYRDTKLLDILAAFMQESVVIERHLFSKDVAQISARCLAKFGLSDTVTSLIAKDNLLVLTDDLPLCGYLQNIGIDALNFNNIRLMRP